MDTTNMRRVLGMVALSACCAAAYGSEPAAQQQWSRFRGPNGSGIAPQCPAGAFPSRWTERDYKWKVQLPGGGYGSPSVWKDRIYLLCCDEKRATRIVVCLAAADGRTIWSRSFPSRTYHTHRDNGYATMTPLVDARGLYLCWATPKSLTLLAMSHEGKELWRRDLGPLRSQHGPGPAPVLAGGAVILANDQQGTSFVIAVDAATGKTLWRMARPSGKTSYSTPCLRPLAGGRAEVIVTSAAAGVTAIDTRTGQVNWQLPDVLPARCVGSPILAGDLVIATCGVGSSGVRLVAIRPGGDAKAAVAYSLRSAIPYVPTPLAKDGLLFILTDTGGVSCIEADTGRQVWRSRLADRFYGSFVCAGGKLYCISRQGVVYVLRAGRKFELLGRNPLGEKSFSTPAVAGGRMYLRTVRHLVCIEGR
ncbi:MAG: PQQ-binding-like beta-propeller repeat protein [Planctomycetes bacterium]|nr:PQQ-binding-like beta-propeller repeat protein [Planctomycetota bacterium]